MRVKLEDKETQLRDAKAALLHAEEQRDDQKELARKLEVEAEALGRNESTLGDKVADVDPSSAILKTILHTPGSNAIARPDASAASTDGSMVSILQEQRNRFRERMLLLESENSKLKAATGEDLKTMKQLRHDNIKLFEKIKYLQAYSNGGKGDDVVINLDDDGKSTQRTETIEQRYKSLYRHKMNPFQNFSKAQAAQRYRSMNVLERLLLDAARFFSQTAVPGLPFSYT